MNEDENEEWKGKTRNEVEYQYVIRPCCITSK